MYSPDEDFLTDDDYYYHHRKPTSSLGYAAHVSARLAAREAGDHLQRMHRRVIDLEDVIRSQGIALSEKDAGHRLLKSQLRELRELKERQIRELNSAISQLEDRNRDLDVEMKKKNEGLDDCQKKLLMLDKLLTNSLPGVEKFLANLKKLNAGNAVRIKAMTEDPLLTTASLINNNTTSPLVSKKTQQQNVSDLVSDSGHPSSASDSYNVLDETSKLTSSLLDKDLMEQQQRNNISTPPRRPSSDLDPRAFRSGSFTGAPGSSSSSSGSPRITHRVRRRNNSRPGGGNSAIIGPSAAALTMESFPSDLTPMRSELAKTMHAIPHHSPSYTPPSVRRSVGPQSPRLTNSHFAHESSSSSSHFTRATAGGLLSSDPLYLDELNLNNNAHVSPSASAVSPRNHKQPSPRHAIPPSVRDNYISGAKLSTEMGRVVLNYSDDEEDHRKHGVSSEPPPPAPPPSVNPGNTNLPSIQIPKRFLPTLSTRY